MKARQFLRPYENHITILKLRRNEPLTPTDLAELERIFLEAGLDEEALSTLRGDGGLGRFVRSLVGLDRSAAKQAFSDFMARRTLSANQLEFVDLIIDQLTDRGIMDPRLLYESPFTDFDSSGVSGVSGVFPAADVHEIVAILREVERRSAA
jgi:type I restriction enzyme R subunit